MGARRRRDDRRAGARRRADRRLRRDRHLRDRPRDVPDLARLPRRDAREPAAPDAERASLRSIAEGLRYARSRPELLGTYLVDINAMFFGMPQALFPAIAAGYGGAEVLGFMLAAPAVGSIVVALLSGWTRHVHRHGRAVALAALTSVRSSIVWAASCACVGTGVVLALLPAFWRYDARDGVQSVTATAPTASCAPASRRSGRGRGAQLRGGASGRRGRAARSCACARRRRRRPAARRARRRRRRAGRARPWPPPWPCGPSPCEPCRPG